MTRNAQSWAPLAFALALACSCAAHAATPGPVPDVARDPAGAWEHFLANADSDTAYPAYEVLDRVSATGDKVDATACRTEAAALRESIALVPVSPALHRAAMLCAEATGDTALAERELAAVAALVRHSLAGATESANGRPVRVLRPHDVRATLLSAGLEPAYAYYPALRVRRSFPFVVAAWDPGQETERHLRFDYMEATVAIMRSEEGKYPYARSSVAAAVLEGLRKATITEGVDAVAWKSGRDATDPAARIAQWRMAAGIGGVQSARAWVQYCAEGKAPAHCAEGLVDTLLPIAEQKRAWPMLLLAYAYAEGIGVARDADAGTRLLDAADARWSRMGASVAYARLWRDAHGDEAALPDVLEARLERARAAGNEDARHFLIVERLARDPVAPLDAADIAFLSQATQNGLGDGFLTLASWAEERKQDQEYARWLQRAADAGNPWAQADVGYDLAYGDDQAIRDKPRGLRYLAEAAHGGNSYAALLRSHDAQEQEDYLAAERWLIDAAGYAYDTQALLEIARLYEWERPGVSGDPAKAVLLYRELAGLGVADARRRLAMMLIDGRHVPQDKTEARALLEAAAADGDHATEGVLGIALLIGQLGPVEEEAGVRWVERALAGGDKATSASYGHWLFYTKATNASRAKAFDVWRAGMRNGDYSLANNLAWALCTSVAPSFRDAAAGMATTREMGALDEMEWGHVDTVAACRAATGDFAGAVELQKRVVDAWRKESAGMKPSKETDEQTRSLDERLKLYEAGKSYIEVPGSTS